MEFSLSEAMELMKSMEREGDLLFLAQDTMMVFPFSLSSPKDIALASPKVDPLYSIQYQVASIDAADVDQRQVRTWLEAISTCDAQQKMETAQQKLDMKPLVDVLAKVENVVAIELLKDKKISRDTLYMPLSVIRPLLERLQESARYILDSERERSIMGPPGNKKLAEGSMSDNSNVRFLVFCWISLMLKFFEKTQKEQGTHPGAESTAKEEQFKKSNILIAHHIICQSVLSVVSASSEFISRLAEKHLDCFELIVKLQLHDDVNFLERLQQVLILSNRRAAKQWHCIRFLLLLTDSCSYVTICNDKRGIEVIENWLVAAPDQWCEFRAVSFASNQRLRAFISISLCQPDRLREFCEYAINTPDIFENEMILFFPVDDDCPVSQEKDAVGVKSIECDALLGSSIAELLPTKKMTANEFCLISCNTWCRKIFTDRLQCLLKGETFSITPFCCIPILEKKALDLRKAALKLARGLLNLLNFTEKLISVTLLNPEYTMRVNRSYIQILTYIIRFQSRNLTHELWLETLGLTRRWFTYLNDLAPRIGCHKYLRWLHILLLLLSDLLFRCNFTELLENLCFCGNFASASSRVDKIIQETDPSDQEYYLDAVFAQLAIRKLLVRLNCKNAKSSTTDLARPRTKFSYDILRVLSLSKHHAVFKCYDFDRAEISVVKEIYFPEGEGPSDELELARKQLIQEAIMLQSLHYRHVVDFVGLQITNEKAIIKMENFRGECLRKFIQRVGPLGEMANGLADNDLIFQILFQVLMGLAFLHAHGVIHRDIKPGNILIDEFSYIKISDFGAANTVARLARQKDVPRRGTEKEAVNELGTVQYMPPEAVRHGDQTIRSDMWSFACMALELITGKPPWPNSDNPWSIMLGLGEGRKPSLNPLRNLGVDERLIAILELCLEADEQQRPTSQAIIHSDYVNNMMTLSC